MIREKDYLMHYGVKGMRWGHRKKYYGSNGELNSLGRARSEYKTAKKEYNRAYGKSYNYSSRHPVTQYYGRRKNKSNKLWEDTVNKAKTFNAAEAKYKAEKQKYKAERKANKKPMSTAKKVAIGTATAAAILGTAYGAYKVNQLVKNRPLRLTTDHGNSAVAIYKNNSAVSLFRGGNDFGPLRNERASQGIKKGFKKAFKSKRSSFYKEYAKQNNPLRRRFS